MTCAPCLTAQEKARRAGHRDWREGVCAGCAAVEADEVFGPVEGETPPPPRWERIPATETLSMRCKTHTALILLAQVPEGWVFAADCSRLTGDVSGWSDCMGRRHGVIDPDRLASTRAEAIAGAVARIRARLPDKPLSDWLDSLVEADAQPDLFEERAA